MRFSIFSSPPSLKIIKYRRGSMSQVEMRTFPETQFGNTFKDDRTTQWNIIQNSWEYKQNAIALTNAGAFQRRHPCCVSTWPSNPTPPAAALISDRFSLCFDSMYWFPSTPSQNNSIYEYTSRRSSGSFLGATTWDPTQAVPVCWA